MTTCPNRRGRAGAIAPASTARNRFTSLAILPLVATSALGVAATSVAGANPAEGDIRPSGVFIAEHLGPFDVIEWFQIPALPGENRYRGMDFGGGGHDATITPDGTLVYDHGGGNGSFSTNDDFTTSFIFSFGTWQTTAHRVPNTDEHFPITVYERLAHAPIPGGTFTGVRRVIEPWSELVLSEIPINIEIEADGQLNRVIVPDGTMIQGPAERTDRAGVRVVGPPFYTTYGFPFPGSFATQPLGLPDRYVAAEIRREAIDGADGVVVTMLWQTTDPAGQQTQELVQIHAVRDEPLPIGDVDGDGLVTAGDLNRWHRQPSDIDGDGDADQEDLAMLANAVTVEIIDCNGNLWPDDDETSPFVFEESGRIGPPVAGVGRTFRVASREHATGPVTISVGAFGEFGSALEFLTVKLGETEIGRAFQFDGATCEPMTDAEFTVDAAVWNDAVAAGAHGAEITLTPSGAVAPTCSPEMFMRASVRIPWTNPRDVDGDRMPDDCPDCPADTNGDGAVTFDDLVSVLGTWGVCPGCPTDVDGDGSVGFADVVALLAAWGPCTG